MSRKGCFGCSLPLAIVITVVVAALVIIGIIAGPVGQSLLPSVHLPSWITVPSPDVRLPAEVIFQIGGFAVTNTILATWVTVIFLVGFSFAVTRRMKIVPGRVQAAFEFLMGWLYDFCTSAAGEENGRRFFPIVATIFLFVGFNAWLGLIPGYASIMVHTSAGEVPLLREANTDFNTPLAVAIISLVVVQYTELRAAGRHYITKFLDIHGLGRFLRGMGQLVRGKLMDGLTDALIGVIQMLIGVIEFISEWFVRTIAFTFRLFGNMTAGEVLLLLILFFAPMLIALPFYMLEMLVGFIQATIFAGLTLAFLVVAVTPHEVE